LKLKARERIFNAIKLKPVDKVPMTYRGTELATLKMMEHFGFENPKDYIGNRKEFIKETGADMWSTGSRLSKFAVFVPTYTGPPAGNSYIEDDQSFYTIGVNTKGSSISPFYGVDPILGNSNYSSDVKDGFLTSRIRYFDFTKMVNRYKDERISYENIKDDPEEIVSIGNLTSVFMICTFLRGMENFLMDLVSNARLAEKIINEVSDFCLEYSRKELEAFGSRAHYYGTWDDVAGQEGIMFPPALFKKYFLPVYKKLIENVKKHNLPFGWHVCGSVTEFMPYMIDAGIDVFDVVQTSARNMDLENIYKLCGGKICIHGGIDVQKVLINKKPAEVREEVKKIKELWGNRGGVIIAPAHMALPETPVENILAIYN